MITLVTGGSGSGKSAFAEDVLTGFGDGDRIYIATMYPLMRRVRSVWNATGVCVRKRNLQR